uniref:Transmembrane protein n=1 Tax=Romanomermis culicivorax TaxID=13658 RepID=A0A915L357_ROMCU
MEFVVEYLKVSTLHSFLVNLMFDVTDFSTNFCFLLLIGTTSFGGFLFFLLTSTLLDGVSCSMGVVAYFLFNFLRRFPNIGVDKLSLGVVDDDFCFFRRGDVDFLTT